MGLLLFLLSCTKEEKGHSYFLFPFFLLPSKNESFLEAGFQFRNFLITLMRPPVSSQDPLPLSLE